MAPSAPEDLQVDQTGATWVTLSWFQTSRSIPPLSRHVISVMEEGGEERAVPVEGSNSAVNMTGLLPGTLYMFRVVAVSEFADVQAPSPPSTTVNATTDTTGECSIVTFATTITGRSLLLQAFRCSNSSVPAPVCSDVPGVEDDRLVVRWTYTHTGGLIITSTDVYFNPNTSPELRTSFSSVSGAVVMDTEGSIPLPEAGLHYQFTVKAENSEGTTEVDCPSLRLDTGITNVAVCMSKLDPCPSTCTCIYLHMYTQLTCFSQSFRAVC